MTHADDDQTAPDAAASEAPRRPWYRRPRRLVLLGVLVLLAVGAALFAFAWRDRGAKEVSTEDVIQRYRDQEGRGDDSSGFLRPAAGVYSYGASGTEKLSLLDTAQHWGPTMPATVGYDADGCWTLRVEYSTNHWQDQKNCPAERTLFDAGGTTFQSFDLVAFTIADTQVFTCEPMGEAIRVDAEPGDSWGQSCDGASPARGTHVTSAGTNTFVGVEELEIGGETVGALHYHLARTLSGDQTGHENTDNWYGVTDGLLLRSTHDTQVASPSPIGDVNYTERGEFQLTSLSPQT